MFCGCYRRTTNASRSTQQLNLPSSTHRTYSLRFFIALIRSPIRLFLLLLLITSEVIIIVHVVIANKWPTVPLSSGIIGATNTFSCFFNSDNLIPRSSVPFSVDPKIGHITYKRAAGTILHLWFRAWPFALLTRNLFMDVFAAFAREAENSYVRMYYTYIHCSVFISFCFITTYFSSMNLQKIYIHW